MRSYCKKSEAVKPINGKVRSEKKGFFPMLVEFTAYAPHDLILLLNCLVPFRFQKNSPLNGM
jgi:hypothetical protein